MFDCVVINLLDNDWNFGQGKELQLWHTTLERFIDKNQEVRLKLLRSNKFHEKLCVFQDQEK